MQVILDGRKVNVCIEKKKIKNIYFKFKSVDELYISSPSLISEKHILKLISENEKSLIKMHSKFIKKASLNEYFIFLGKKYIKCFSSEHEEVYFNDGYVFAKDDEMLSKFTDDFALTYFTKEVDRIKNYFNDIPSFKLKIRQMKTRWGVCNRKDNIITLNKELVKRSREELGYVIVHELCHFYEGNHQKKFWEHVKKYCPNYKNIRKQLRES